MGLSAIESHSPGAQAVASREIPATSNERVQDGQRRPTAKDQSRAEHPRRNWSSGEIVEHIVGVHHRFLRRTMAHLSKQISDVIGKSSARSKQWNALMQRFLK